MATHMHENLWNFALRTYGAQGVSEACLSLQDESGVDVPVLLFALWLAANSVELSESELQRTDTRVREWREEVIRPLRAVRRRLKTGPFPAPSGETEALRNSVKAAELNSEKIELALLEEEGSELIARMEKADDAASRNAATVVRYYRGSDVDSLSQTAIDTILRVLSKPQK